MPLRQTTRRRATRLNGNRRESYPAEDEQMESKYTQVQRDLKSCAEQMSMNGLTSMKDVDRLRQLLKESEDAIHHRENTLKAALKQLKKTYSRSLLEDLQKMDWSTTGTPAPDAGMTDEEASIYDPESDSEPTVAPAATNARDRVRSRAMRDLNDLEREPINVDQGDSPATTRHNGEPHQPRRSAGVRGRQQVRKGTSANRQKAATFPRNAPIQYKDVLRDGIPHSYILSHIKPGKFYVMICRPCKKYFGRQGKEVMRGAERHVRSPVHTVKKLTAHQKAQFAIALPNCYFHAAWLLGYCVEDCTAELAFQSNVAFLCHHTSQGVETIFKTTFEQFKHLLPSEQISKQNVEKIYRQCKGFDRAVEEEASSGDGAATPQDHPQRTAEQRQPPASDSVRGVHTNSLQSSVSQNDPFAGYNNRFDNSPARRTSSAPQLHEDTMLPFARPAAAMDTQSVNNSVSVVQSTQQSSQTAAGPVSRPEHPSTEQLIVAGSRNREDPDDRVDIHLAYNDISHLVEPSGLPSEGTSFRLDSWDHRYPPSGRTTEAAI